MSTSNTNEPRRRFRPSAAGFLRDRRGVTAVEFGLVAAPFLALTFAIIEISLLFWNQQVLETAVANVARQIYTGSFQQDSTNSGKSNAQLAAEFKTRLCAEVRAMFDCNSMITVDIRPASDFSNASVGVPVTTDPITHQKVYDTTGWGYTQPQQNSVVVVRAAMQYPAFTSILGANQANLSNGNHLIMASAAFRTEPFGTAPVPTN